MAHTVEIKEIINGVQITETIDGNIVEKLISHQSKPFLRTTNETDEETYQVLDIVGEIYNTPALATDFRIIDKNGNVFIPADGVELIEYSKKIRAFRPDADVNEVLAVGPITTTSNSVTLGLHASGTNAVRIDGLTYEKYYPDLFNFTPVTTGVKILIIYALPDAQVFHLVQGAEAAEAIEPELPAGALFIRRIVVTTEGADVDPETLSGYIEKREAAWKSVVLTSAGNYSLPFSADDNISNFFITKKGTNIQTITGIDKTSDADKSYNGREFLIFNYAGTDIILNSTSGNSSTQWLFLSLQTPITLKARQSARVKLRNGILYVIQSGGSASFPETGNNADVLVKDSAVDGGVKWSNRLTNVETGKLDKPPTDGSWVITKSGSNITYTDASTFGQNIANTNLTWSADRTQNLNAKKLSFTGGRVSVPALELEITAENSVPNKIWTDGADFWLTNNLGINTKITENKLVQGNYNPPTLAQIAAMNLFRGDYYKHIGTGQISQFNGELLDNWYCSVAEWNALSVAQKNAVKNFNVY